MMMQEPLKKKIGMWLSLACLLLSIIPNLKSAQAQTDTIERGLALKPDESFIALSEYSPISAPDDGSEFESTKPFASSSALKAVGASAPDNYGYYWDDKVPLEWIDATGGTNTGMTGNSPGQATAPIPMGFIFPFYENEYNEVTIAASGYVSFNTNDNWPSQSQIPTSSEPNNVIAPYWSPLYLDPNDPSGEVFYLQGGEAPDRYFVVEWNNVAGYRPDGSGARDDLFHFQVVLHENGDITFQYALMNFTDSSYCGSAGIENASGEDGLSYLSFCSSPPSDIAVRFSRPDPSARIKLSPPYQSDFINPGGKIRFSLLLSNLGDLGADVYELEITSEWAVQILGDNGLSPFVDTNGNGTIDTGPLDEQESLIFFVEISADPGASIGAGDEIAITATSILDDEVSQTVNLQVAVPTRFMQAFRDDADGAMGLLLSGPEEVNKKLATSNGWWGYNPSIAETAAGNFLYLWERYRYLGETPIVVSELEYVLLDYRGEPINPVTRLTDHTISGVQTYDEEPVLAPAPDGSIGVAWRRRVVQETLDGNLEKWNVYFAVLDPSGALTFGPINLTQNDTWFVNKTMSIGVPRFWNARIAANSDNQFAITWHQETSENPTESCQSNCSLNDIYFTLYQSNGLQIKPITRLTPGDVNGNKTYASPKVINLSGRRWLLAYNHFEGGMAFSVLDAAGDLIRERSFIDGTGYGWSLTAVQPLGSDRIVLAWTSWTANNPQIHVTVLNSDTYQKISGPQVLSSPAATTGGDYASITLDPFGNVILTWMDFISNARENLYYTLLNQEGDLISKPMVYLSAENGEALDAHIETGLSGYTNTTNRQFLDVPLTYWAAPWIERLYDAGITTGCTTNPPKYCSEANLTRAEMAVLLGRQIHGTHQPPNGGDPDLGEVFGDVSGDYWAAAWIEQLYEDGITRGCSTAPLLFCPNEKVTRDEMAVFLVRFTHGDSSLLPDPTGDVFADVPVGYWAAAEIEQLYRDGITTGCGADPLRFCPYGQTTRAEIAAFLVRTFNLP
jgi:hypothetical protein